jgi:predicted MFS family arabinose efflux permease
LEKREFIKVDASTISHPYQNAFSASVLWASACFAGLLGFSRLSYGLLLPSIRTDLGGSYGFYGLVGTANFIGYLTGTLVVPIILTRYHNRVQLNLWALLGMNFIMILSALSWDLWSLSIVRLVVGFFSAVGTVLTMGLVLERVLPTQRGLASGLVWMGGSIGIVISGLIAPLIIGSGVTGGWRFVWVIMGLLGIVASFGVTRVIKAAPAPVLPTPLHTKDTPRPSVVSIMTELFRPKGLLLLTISYFGFGFGYIIYSTFFIPLLVDQGMPSLYAGLIWSALGAAGVFGAFLWGRMLDRWPNGFTLAAGLGLGAVGALSVLVGGTFSEIIGAVLTGLSFLGPPLIVTVLLRREVAADRYTSSFSFLTSIFAMGQITGPLVGGIVVDNFGLIAGISVTAIMLGLATLLAIWYGLLHRPKQSR